MTEEERDRHWFALIVRQRRWTRLLEQVECDNRVTRVFVMTVGKSATTTITYAANTFAATAQEQLVKIDEALIRLDQGLEPDWSALETPPAYVTAS